MEHDGLVALGDMGYLDDEGFLFIVDRKSDMVISGGVNIYPAEIESVLVQMPGVADCAVFGVPRRGIRRGAAGGGAAGARRAAERRGRATCLHERIANYKVPRRDRVPGANCRAKRPARSSSASCASRTGLGWRGGFDTPADAQRCGRVCRDMRPAAHSSLPGLAPAGDSLSFASPKESKPRKGDPTVCVPALRRGNLPSDGPSRGSAQLAALKHVRTHPGCRRVRAGADRRAGSQATPPRAKGSALSPLWLCLRFAHESGGERRPRV